MEVNYEIATSAPSVEQIAPDTFESTEEDWKDTILHPQFSPHIYYFSPSQSKFTSLPSRQCTILNPFHNKLVFSPFQLKSPTYTVVSVVHFSFIEYISILENMWPGYTNDHTWMISLVLLKWVFSFLAKLHVQSSSLLLCPLSMHVFLSLNWI